MTAVLTRIREVAVVRRNNRTDWILVGTVLLLSGFGLLMIYSATRSVGTFSMERQMIFVAAGLIIFAIVSNIDYREYRSIVPAASIIILLLLAAVFFFPEINGARRWIPIGFFALQPAEFAKIVVIVALASLLAPPASREDLMSGPRQLSWAKVGQALLVVAVPGALIYLEPDLGTTLVFGFIVFGMLFVAGASWRQLTALATGVGVAGLLIWRLDLLQPHQLNRLEVLWNPDIDPQGIGYQLR
ncbi:MAG TPA: FtsW/RodA/SpoVE family cell cycle protein, partial [Acidimicrobiia bacterium]